MKLAITVCATQTYTYALKAQARRVVANLQGHPPGLVVMVGDQSKEFKAAYEYWQKIFPENWKFAFIENPAYTEHANYKEPAQIILARMRGEAFLAARAWGATQCWSLDSDVLPPANALACMQTMLAFDANYYDVSTCSYPNDAYLGGRGTPQNPIAPNYYLEELQLPTLVQNALSILDKRIADDELRIANSKEQPDPQNPEPKTPIPLPERKARIEGWIMRRNYPPQGNVFELNAKYGWRPRGWLEHAYPGIGRGAVVPVDWCGFGCTLMSQRALAHAHFEGYEGKGTEDLWVCWKQWHPQGIRINTITHVVCDHVIHQKKKGGSEGEYIHLRAYHETQGETAGHIRTDRLPWIDL